MSSASSRAAKPLQLARRALGQGNTFSVEPSFPHANSTAHTSLATLIKPEIEEPAWLRDRDSRIANFKKHSGNLKAMDGGVAAADAAYLWSEQAFIYPITPATALCDAAANWASAGRKNLYGSICQVTQMQSEGGAAGATHGVVDVGSLVTTFTSSQGLLLMIPNMYIIAGALNPCVFHIAARAITKSALCIFGDHTDIMAARQTGFSFISGRGVQEAHDLGIISHVSSLRGSIPIGNFFDGFRTSHEINKIYQVPKDVQEQLVPWEELTSYRERGLKPSNPHVRNAGMFQDTFFQAGESVNLYYDNMPFVVQKTMDEFGVITGRNYKLFEYDGHPEAEHVTVIMGSGCGVVKEYIDYVNRLDGVNDEAKKIGVISVHLFRPWSDEAFLRSLPSSVKTISVMDRTKESGASAEPLFTDVATSLQKYSVEGIKLLGGRYGLGSREFSPGMVGVIFDNARLSVLPDTINVGDGVLNDTPERGFNIMEGSTGGAPQSLAHLHHRMNVPSNVTERIGMDLPHVSQQMYKNKAYRQRFTLGIFDDVSNTALDLAEEPDTAPIGTQQCLFFGMGSDGTLSANKSAIKIIGDNTNLFTQAYFSYDSHKAGGATISNLRFGPQPIDMAYSITQADYVAVSQPSWVKKFPAMIGRPLKKNCVVVLNHFADTVKTLEEHVPSRLLADIAKANAKLYVIDAAKVAREAKLGRFTNNILQMVFFKLSEVIPFEEAEHYFKESMRKQYALKGEDVIARNITGVDKALAAIRPIEYPIEYWAGLPMVNDPPRAEKPEDVNGPKFVTGVLHQMAQMEGGVVPTSGFNPRGHWIQGTTQYEKREIALAIPILDAEKCTQCNECSAICPHAAIRPFLISQSEMDQAPSTFTMKPAVGGTEVAGYQYRIQVAPQDCTGCEACSWTCKDNALTMTPLQEVLEKEKDNWAYAMSIPNRGHLVDRNSTRGAQFQQPLLEFSGACEGCGETPYAKLVTQLFGHRMVIANSSGCSSVWAGTGGFSSLTTRPDGKGPAWGRSLFEDTAEYGFGMARAIKQRRDTLAENVTEVLRNSEAAALLPLTLRTDLRLWLAQKENSRLADIYAERIPKALDELPAEIKKQLPYFNQIITNKDVFAKVSTWIWGGDGWAYDIGFGGLDHVLQAGVDINVFVMDTEGYSNTGGQVSKASTFGATQKFAPDGYRRAKKDLGAIAMGYGDIYVASISMGSNFAHSVSALLEAEAYPGTSLILCYSPCIEHKIKFPRGLSHLAQEMDKAVQSGYWNVYKYNPLLINVGKNPLQLQQKKLNMKMRDFTSLENRFEGLKFSKPVEAEILANQLQEWAQQKISKMLSTANEPVEGAQELVSIPATDPSGKKYLQEITILYASETGNTALLSEELAAQAKSRGVKVHLLNMADIDVSDIIPADQEEKNVMLLISTAGEGAFPGSAIRFWEQLNSEESAPSGCFQGLNLSVFGLGDTGYTYFNKSAKRMEEAFVGLGATLRQETGLGDDRAEDKYWTALEPYMEQLWTDRNAAEPQNDHLITNPKYSLIPVAEAPYQPIEFKSSVLLKRVKNERITSLDYNRSIRHLVFDIGENDFSYLLGDAVNIYPKNDPEVVLAFLKNQCLDPESIFQIEYLDAKAIDAPAGFDPAPVHSFQNPMTLKQLFTDIVDITGRPNKTFYKQLAKFAQDENEKAQLQSIGKNTSEGVTLYNSFLAEVLTYADIFAKYKSIRMPIEHILTHIPAVKPRLYSIASSQRLKPDKLELVIVIHDYLNSKGEHRRGLCTNYIERTGDEYSHEEGDLVACSITTGSFNFPETMQAPMIMTGLGTGLAPFRAFVEERAAWKQRFDRLNSNPVLSKLKSDGELPAKVNGEPIPYADYKLLQEKAKFEAIFGNMWLFYGCRYRTKDYIFADEMEDYVKQGVISNLQVAFSRDGPKKVYVQNLMRDNAMELGRDIVENGGFVYLCGQAGQVEKDINAAVIDVIKTYSAVHRPDVDALKLFEQMQADHRLCYELY